MILIFGGAYQGKLDYALTRFGLTMDDVARCDEMDAALPKGRIIYEIDKWIWALLDAGADVPDAVGRLDRDAIVICNDISCGVVPTDAARRKWREAVGRQMAAIAQASDEVVRLFCGIPARIK